MTTTTLIQRIKDLTARFGKGWHDGIQIDASDIADLCLAADALEQQAAWQAALSAPPGYALVPVEPTDEMIDATYHGQPLADIWHDMIAAAPSAKEQTP